MVLTKRNKQKTAPRTAKKASKKRKEKLASLKALVGMFQEKNCGDAQQYVNKLRSE